MWKEFKEFAVRGNLVDLAIAVIIGNAFSKIVTSIVNDIVMPPLGLIIGRVDFSSLYINLSGKHYATFAAAKAASAPTINIGTFINNVVNFLIVAIVMFMVVKQLNHLKKTKPAGPPPRLCPYCLQEVELKASRCPHCTSQLEDPKAI